MKYYFTNQLKSFLTSPFKLYPLQNQKMIFDNFNGRGPGDNPKYIMDELLRSQQELDLVWVVKDDTIAVPSGVRVVKHGSLKAFYEWATAKVWVDNIRNSDRPRKRKGQVYLQTWHGSFGAKLVEKDVEESLSRWYVRMAKYDGKITDGILSSHRLQTDLIKRSFWLSDQTEVLEFGLPRNDDFFNQTEIKEAKEKIRHQYGIDDGDFVLLYMPTFRDNGDISVYDLDYEELIKACEEGFGKPTKILVRFHPNVDINFFKSASDQIINVSDASSPQDLMFASDMMISDYSSSPVDFMLLKRPVILYTPDYEIYTKRRPLDSSFNSLPFEKCFSEMDLRNQIKSFDLNAYFQRLNAFEETNKSFDDGHASKRVVEWLMKKL